MVEHYREMLEMAAAIIELFAVAIIVIGFLKSSYTYSRSVFAKGREAAFHQYCLQLGNALLLGLEVLVVADVIESITNEPSYQSRGVLAFLIVVRTMISWSTTLQSEGRWPWQAEASEKAEKG